MENEQITVALTLAHWNALLNTLGHAPYGAVNAINEIVGLIHNQANTQIAELQKKYPPEEAAAAE